MHLFSANQSQMQTSHVPAYLHSSSNKKNVACLHVLLCMMPRKSYVLPMCSAAKRVSSEAAKPQKFFYFSFLSFTLMDERVKRLTFSIVKVCCDGTLFLFFFFFFFFLLSDAKIPGKWEEDCRVMMCKNCEKMLFLANQLFANFVVLLGQRISKLLSMRHMLHYLSVSHSKCQIRSINISLWVIPKITLKKQFYLNNFLENINGPKV